MVDESRTVPAGFEAVASRPGFSDRLQPYYRRVDGDDVTFGLFVEEQHLNLLGICHGGALMTLADVAAASSLSRLSETPGPMPTINLSFDFQSPGRKGRWLQTQATTVELRRRFGFCSGLVLDGDTVVLRYSSVFYLPDYPMGDPRVTEHARQALSGDGDGGARE